MADKDSILRAYKEQENQIKGILSIISKINEGQTYEINTLGSKRICTVLEHTFISLKVLILAHEETGAFDRFNFASSIDKGVAYGEDLDHRILVGAELFDPLQAPLIVNWDFISREFKTKYF